MKKQICQVTKKEFTISDNEELFCQKIGVPPPTLSPEARFQRRLMRRNERMVKMRECNGSKKRIMSAYDENTSFPVYSSEYWYSDGWDGSDYGREYDFSKPFFEQFMELESVTPRIHLWQVNSVNSDYSNYVVDSKNCYLCFTALGGNEDCMYCSYITSTINCIDCDNVTKCDKCYECFNCDICYDCKFCVDSSNCINSMFLRDCSNCTDCFGCVGLKDKQYYVFNKGHAKDEYEKIIKDFKVNDRQNSPQFEDRVTKMWNKFPHRYMHGKKAENTTGDYVLNSNNCENSFLINDCEDSRNLFFTVGLKDCMDVTVSVIQNELLYECHAIPKQGYNVKFSDICSNGCTDIEYCSNCDSSSNLFGCVGLRKKEYCIFNKQYTKEEYKEFVPKIKRHMDEMPYTDKRGVVYKYGEFFPPESSLFSYNESLAQEYFPLTKKEAEDQNYAWKDQLERDYKITVSGYEVSSDITEVDDSIKDKIIGCINEGEGVHNCQTAFRIMPDELTFYKQHNIPIPQYCPNCRHHRRVSYRNKLELRGGSCDCSGDSSKNDVFKNTTEHFHGSSLCPNKFLTTYLDDKTIVYCKECYQKEVS